MKARKVLKRSNDSTVENNATTKHPWFDYRDMFSGDMKPMSEKGIEKVADDLVVWARTNDDAFKLSQFYLERGISINTWKDWVDKFPKLKESQEMAKCFIGNRREIGAIKNKLNTSMVAYTMPFYDNEWKEETVRRASLKGEAAGDGKESITVVLNPIPNSEVVLQRNVKEDKEQ